MNVELSLAVYQRKEGGELSWTTLGLGELTETVRGHSAVKTQRRLVAKLRTKLRDVEAAELERFQLHRGLRLVRVRLEVVVSDGMGRARVSGVFPLVAEPRKSSAEQRVIVVYHPWRQDDWLFVEHEHEVATAAEAFFRHAWSALPLHEVEALRTDGKDVIKPLSFSAAVRPIDARDDRRDQRGRARREVDVLSEIGQNQTLRAIEKTLPLGMPRPGLRKRLWLALGGRNKKSSVLVGPPKTGKSTAIARWIADLLDGDDYATHHSLDRIHQVWRVSGKRLIAGMSHLGDWEERCLDLLAQLGKARVILWIDDLHLWGKLGRSRESERSFADFFRGPVARGELTVVGECTEEQLFRLEDDAPSFAKLFDPIAVPPATRADTLQMLVHEGSRLELEVGCRFHPLTYRTILEMGAALSPWTAFPGKAIDTLEKLADARESSAAQQQPIEPTDVVALLSRETGLPESLLTLESALDLDLLQENLESRVMGQAEATRAACDLVSRIRAGLTDPKRPYAVMLFTGPTGTGKTELAKQIAQFLYGDVSRLIRFDMSELSGPDAVARLIGDGYTAAGQLTRRIREQPFSVLLLDEIEKAHRSVLNLLLQLFDDARLTDAAGDTTSFAHSVIIMTSNLGARASRPVGFGDVSNKVMADIAAEVASFFPPELFNRIDTVVPFRPLSPEVAEAVAVKELAELFARRGMKERNIFVYAAAAVKERIVADAFDERWGARTVKRFLEDRVGSLLAEHISGAKASAMQVVRLYEVEGSFRLHAEPLEEVGPELEASPMEALLEAPVEELARHAAAVAARVGAAAGSAARFRDAAHGDPTLLYYVDWYERRARELASLLGGDDAEDRADLDARLWAGTVGERLRLPVRGRRAAGREEQLARIGEGLYHAGHTDALADGAAHRARLCLLGINHEGDRSPAPLSGRGSGRLIELLLDAYEGQLEVTAVAGRHLDGSIVTRRDDILGASLTHVVLDVAGFAVARLLAGEVGCHIRRSVAAEPEIVRVRVLEPSESPAAVLRHHEEALAAFDRALEAGAEELPENPALLMPAVRTVSFDLPLRAGEVFAVEVEDFREAYAATLHVRSLRQVIERLWLLRRGRT